MKIGQPSTIRLRLRELAQLFNSMDPSPFNDQDLDRDAEESMLTWHHSDSVHCTLAPPTGYTFFCSRGIRQEVIHLQCGIPGLIFTSFPLSRAPCPRYCHSLSASMA